MKKVLIISTVGLLYDGITSVILSYLEKMDLMNLDIHIVETIKAESSIKERFEKLGCKVVSLPNRRSDTLKYFVELKKYIKKEKIDVVHIHGNSCTLAIDLLAAKIGGAKKRIAHSHNTKCDQKIANFILRPLFDVLYTDALACGEEAGKWLFKNRKFNILPNGRDVEKYKFNSEIREKMRDKFSVGNDLVIGHVGGFFEQKNHRFIVDVFREVLKIQYESRLILVGDGPLKAVIENEVSDIKDKIVFVGTTNKVEDYLQMMDIMLFPSLFEGLPLVLIEWEINGLPSVVSDVVTQECILTNNVYRLSLNKSSYEWAKFICDNSLMLSREEEGRIGKEKIEKSDFNIVNSASKLRELYEV